MEKLANLSVILDAGCRPEFLPLCLSSLAKSQEVLCFSVLVVASCDVDLSGFPSFSLLVQTGGAGVRLNAAARQAGTDYLLYLKPNVLLDAAGIEGLYETVSRDMAIAAAVPKLVHRNGEAAASEFILIEDQCKRRPIDALARPTKIERTEDWVLPPIDGIAFRSDALLMRKIAFWGAGGWSEQFENDMLDLSLCLAIKEQNWRIVYEPAATAVTLIELPPEVSLSVSEYQILVRSWYGKFLPHALRTSDGILRGHPWWNCSKGTAQQVGSPFEVLPLTVRSAESPIPGERCSVVVVTFNSMETIKECVESVLMFIGTFDELVLVDNASRDGTPLFIEGLIGTDPRVKVVLNDENLGFSEGCNVGIRASSGEYIVLLNPDTVVNEGWLARMRAHFEDPSVGAVGPMSNGVFGLQQFPLHLPRNAKDSMSPDEIHALIIQVNARRGVESKLLIGFCLMMRRSVLDEMGLMDPDLFLGYDDLDLSWRLRLRGLRLIIATDVLVLHKVHASFKTLAAPVVLEFEQRSAQAFSRKLEAHYGKGNVPPEWQLWGINWFAEKVDVWEKAA